MNITLGCGQTFLGQALNPETMTSIKKWLELEKTATLMIFWLKEGQAKGVNATKSALKKTNAFVAFLQREVSANTMPESFLPIYQNFLDARTTAEISIEDRIATGNIGSTSSKHMMNTPKVLNVTEASIQRSIDTGEKAKYFTQWGAVQTDPEAEDVSDDQSSVLIGLLVLGGAAVSAYMVFK